MAPTSMVVRLLAVTGSDNVEGDPPPRWAVWVARVIAVLIVLPVRFAWEWVKAVGWTARRLLLRPLAGVLRRAWTSGGALTRFLWRRVVVPVGAGVRWVFGAIGAGSRAIGRLLVRYLIKPTGVFLRFLRDGLRRVFGALGRGLVALGRGVVRHVLRPTGVFLRAVAELVGRGLRALVDGVRWVFRALGRFAVRPAGRGLRRLLDPVRRRLRAAVTFVGDALEWAVRALTVPLAWCRRVLVVAPVRWLWLEVVVRATRAFGNGLLWVWRNAVVPTARTIGNGLRWVWRNVVVLTAKAVGNGLWWLLRLFTSAVIWAFRKVGRGLALLGRAIRAVCGWAGRRVALPLWRFAKQAFHALAVTPARWVGRTILAPAVRLTRRAWQAAVVAPARRVHSSVVTPVQLAGRRVRDQLRSAFGTRRNQDE
ncbi:hypothetical protein ACRAKI_23565 [Saccharothrix isguenensis]